MMSSSIPATADRAFPEVLIELPVRFRPSSSSLRRCVHVTRGGPVGEGINVGGDYDAVAYQVH